MDRETFEKLLVKKGFGYLDDKIITVNALVDLLIRKNIVSTQEFKDACSAEMDRVIKKLEQMPDDQN